MSMREAEAFWPFWGYTERHISESAGQNPWAGFVAKVEHRGDGAAE